MKILVDMNLSPDWARVLEDQGFVARHWSSIGDSSATDAEVLAWARANEFVVFTHDLDFASILAASGAATPSVIQLRAQGVTPERFGTLVGQALDELAENLERGALISLETTRRRVRILPIRR